MVAAALDDVLAAVLAAGGTAQLRPASFLAAGNVQIIWNLVHSFRLY